MTEAEHAQIVRNEAEGRIRIGIDRTAARKFYTEASLRSIEEATGERPYFEKLFVFVCYIGGPVALLSAAILSIVYFGWWSIAVVPVVVLLWMAYYGNSARGSSGLTGITVVLIAVLALHLFNQYAWRSTLFCVVFAVALWLGRCVYVASTIFLRAFVIRSYRAFALLSESIVLKGT